MEFCTGLIGRLFWTSTVTNHRGTSNQHKIILICSPWIQTKLTHVTLNRCHLWLNLVEIYVLKDTLSYIMPWVLINTVSTSTEDRRRKVLKRVLLTITLQGGTLSCSNEVTVFKPHNLTSPCLSMAQKLWPHFKPLFRYLCRPQRWGTQPKCRCGRPQHIHFWTSLQ